MRVATGNWISAGRCPFTTKDSTRKRFEDFKLNFPEFKEYIETQNESTVSARKKILQECRKKWRLSKKRRMLYKIIIKISKGDIFHRAFSPATWQKLLQNPTVALPATMSIVNSSSGKPGQKPKKRMPSSTSMDISQVPAFQM